MATLFCVEPEWSPGCGVGLPGQMIVFTPDLEEARATKRTVEAGDISGTILAAEHDEEFRRRCPGLADDRGRLLVRGEIPADLLTAVEGFNPIKLPDHLSAALWEQAREHGRTVEQEVLRIVGEHLRR